MAYIPHNQSTLAMFLELLNSVSSAEITLDNVAVSNPYPIDPVGIRNTAVQVNAIPGEGLSDFAVTRHRRLDLGAYLNPLAVTLSLPMNALTTHDCIASFNGRFGTGLQETDVEDLPIVGNTVTFRFTNQCYAYVGEVDCTASYTGTDQRPQLADAIDVVELSEFVDPQADYSSAPVDLLRLAIQAYNGIVLPNDKYIFTVPVPYEGSDFNGDTKITLVSTATSFYQGQVDIYYNRADWGSFFPTGVEIITEEAPSTVSDALPLVNAAINFQLGDYDVVGGAFSSGQSIVASDHGVLLQPGSELTVNISAPPATLVCPYVYSTDPAAALLGAGSIDFDTTSYTGDVLTLTAEQPIAGYIKDMSTVVESDVPSLAQRDTEGFYEGDVFRSIPLDGNAVIGMEVSASGLDSVMPSSAYNDFGFGFGALAVYGVDEQSEETYQFQDVFLLSLESAASGNPGAVVTRVSITANAVGGVAQEASGEVLVPKSVKYPGMSSEERLGVYYNQATKQLGVISSVHGDIGYIEPYDSGNFQNKTPFQALHDEGAETMSIIVNAGLGVLADLQDTPGNISLNVNTKQADFGMPFPAGCIDTCGGEVSRTLVVHPLNMSEAALAGIGAGKLTPSMADQMGSLIVEGDGRVADTLHLMVSDVALGLPSEGLDLSSIQGWCGFEFEVSAPTVSTPGGSQPAYQSTASVGAIGETLPAVDFSFFVNRDGDHRLKVEVPGIEGHTTTYGISSAPIHRFGIMITPQGGGVATVRVWDNGQELILSGDDFVIPEGAHFPISMYTTSGMAPTGTPTTAYVRLISDPYWFTTPFPQGGYAIDDATPIPGYVPPALGDLVSDGDLDGLNYPDD